MKMQGFVKILASMNDKNPAWGNALLRIGDILQYHPVGITSRRSQSLSFQKGYLPILEYLASNLVLKTTRRKNIISLYTVVENNYEAIHKVIDECVGGMIEAKSWKDPAALSPRDDIDGVLIFRTLTTVLFQLFTLFKDVVRNHRGVAQLVNDVIVWFETWSQDVSADPPCFQDILTDLPPKARASSIARLREEVTRLHDIVQRESDAIERKTRPQAVRARVLNQPTRGLNPQLVLAYDPPGNLRSEGPRHDNDAADIRDIRIPPTNDELLCAVHPYLPPFRPDAPHHLRADSMARHVDILFRLLREELISTMRSSIRELQSDLTTMWQMNNRDREQTALERILASRGGVYRSTGPDSAFFQVYTGVSFADVRTERQTVTVGLVVDTPDHLDARSHEASTRYQYWQYSKRLQSGNLVALLIVEQSTLAIYLGVLASTNVSIAKSAQESAHTIQIRVSFFEAEVQLRALRRENLSVGDSTFAFLIDNSVMFEAARPFLHRLQTIEPTEIPFARYIAHTNSLDAIESRPPRYATTPGFEFKLSCLEKPGYGERIDDLNIFVAGATDVARQQLMESSELDSFVGKEIVRVLIASGIKPIVLVAFTNHALDHLLAEILDANITTDFVRIGSRVSDERLTPYTLDHLEDVGDQSMEHSVMQQYRSVQSMQQDLEDTMRSIQLPDLNWRDISSFLDIHYPEHAESFFFPPSWIAGLFQAISKDEEENDSLSPTIYGFWRRGLDMSFVSQANSESQGQNYSPSSASLSKHTSARDVLAGYGYTSRLPYIPITARPILQLQESNSSNVWSMSHDERHRLSAEWEQCIRQSAYKSHVDEYERLVEGYQMEWQIYNDTRNDPVSPKVLIVEEAGQVLEAHTISCLPPSVEQLICIGDPRQLRPNLATFTLSTDNERGNKLFKFDRSLMERLADDGLPMSILQKQRRMRPTISHLIRTILYPELEDHGAVHAYPSVQGMRKDVFFCSHTNKENGVEESVSKYNEFEVEMIRDLVLYFLKQGIYNGAGDIAVLCAYLGQVQRVSVSLDQRDKEQLVQLGIDEGHEFDRVAVGTHVRLGTVDVFQGQEAKIVIVSLVRNSGTTETQSASIGFLKSANRINVALSRAKHGLYILGNAANLRKNETWSKIIDEMDAREQIGLGFPIVCPRHPEQTQMVSKPGELSRFAPGGGCLLPCEYRLPCGHNCPSSTTIATQGVTILATKLPARVVILAHGDAGKTVVAANFLCIISHCHADTSRTEFHGQSTKISSTLRTYSRNGVLPRSQIHSMQGAVQRRSDMLLQDLQVCMLPLPDGDRWTHIGNNANADRSPLQLLVQGGLPTAMRASQVPEALLRALCAVHGAVSVDMRPPFVSCCLRLDLCASTLRRAVYEHAPMWTSLSVGRKQDIVDFIMQRQLKEVDLESSDISERLIRLGCGHMFTVETLDGHCKMSEYYEMDDMGQFVATKAPPISYQTPPTCPTCRGPIDALRYGRVTKRATLDILEQNVASRMSKALDEASGNLEQLSSRLEGMRNAAKKLRASKFAHSSPLSARTAAGKPGEPLDPSLLTSAAMHNTHGFFQSEADAWLDIVGDIVRVYENIVGVANIRGAHVRAYDAALATLYRLEMDAIAQDPERTSLGAPEPLAMETARERIGQPPYQADKRFQVEAYILSLEARFMLAQVAESRVQGLPLINTTSLAGQYRQQWFSFLEFILESCVADARKALSIAQESSASRQAARCAICVLRSEFELHRTRILAQRAELMRRGEYSEVTRATLADEAELDSESREYMGKRRSHNVEEMRWFEDNCARKVKRWQEECDELAKYLVGDTSYEPLSLQEKEDIVKAFNFSHRGHFYNCENGHTFVIGECGGATQSARCPECNAPIGGTNHQVHNANTRARDFEQIAGEQGAMPGAFAWTRDA
ncbi:hypothetical protein POSPLADRAFT_1050853 [Postia placenta MAD-698-R-SB12]|uniref:RZ-type domain-containing protein n=1 Tax=Postia placenta MAD-698-R-SB12 TaxID=670580 RepID=A0A1X6MIU6_9APHY|nr:hypothetical protein POSPLADRAFT_1050853 [Postia placenta MAD-698-R-SB12]OSX56367.1 hypothetical protein POSPLADRAFT_1050853 [Postia placenta MAD-698-R-SB12]